MDQRRARMVAETLGGEVWHSGGGLWLVLFRKVSGIVVISDEMVCEYSSMEEYEVGRSIAEVHLL